MSDAINGTLSTTFVDAPDDVYTAKTYATAAINAAAVAGKSAGASSGSEKAAATSASAAAASASAAKTSETTATNKASAAASSASAAKTSETNAASSASAASASKDAAVTSASNAASSAVSAAGRATAAENSQTAAKASETAAASSASAAAGSATMAKNWAESTSSPDGATDSDSSTGKTQSSKSWATYSKDRATAAASSATAAASSKSAAATSATNAASSATAAKNSQTAAATSATAAKTSETNAASSATAAANSAASITYATDTEAAAGTATDRVINPATLNSVLTPIKTNITNLQTATTSSSLADTFFNSIIPQSAAAHNAIYRGNDLTSYFSSGEMSRAIAAGTFVNIFPGDYITKTVVVNGTTYSNVKWIVADLDYFLHRGDTETTAHHVVMVSENSIGTSYMNGSNTTSGGYRGSYMWQTTMPLYATGITNAFGSAHVLSHRERLTTAVDTNSYSAAGGVGNGASTYQSGEWTSVTANIMNEAMLFGSSPFGSSGRDTYDCNKQLAVFRYGQNFTRSNWCWLRDVASSIYFANAGDGGEAGYGGASDVSGVRPYFLLL